MVIQFATHTRFFKHIFSLRCQIVLNKSWSLSPMPLLLGLIWVGSGPGSGSRTPKVCSWIRSGRNHSGLLPILRSNVLEYCWMRQQTVSETSSRGIVVETELQDTVARKEASHHGSLSSAGL